jgi:hypothetical protein
MWKICMAYFKELFKHVPGDTEENNIITKYFCNNTN